MLAHPKEKCVQSLCRLVNAQHPLAIIHVAAVLPEVRFSSRQRTVRLKLRVVVWRREYRECLRVARGSHVCGRKLRRRHSVARV